MARAAEKIAEMLEDYNPTEVEEALVLIEDGPQVQQPSSYDINVGEEVGIGEEGRLELSEMPVIERIIDQNNLLPVHFLTEGADLQGAVGKVIVSPPGWVGTSFMVSPTLFMTNNHVLRNTTDASNARVKLNYQRDHNGNAQQVDEYRGGSGVLLPHQPRSGLLDCPAQAEDPGAASQSRAAGTDIREERTGRIEPG